MTDFHLAQVNVARLLESLDSPQLAGFVSALEPINALADAAPGFVWRLQTEEGNATSIRAFDDDMLLVNLSLWESLDALTNFVFRSSHRDVLVQRKKWFGRMDEAFLALWWVRVGHRPTVEEASERLEMLRIDGPTAEAFTFKTQFAAAESAAALAMKATELPHRRS